jgi:hypothetical protein
LETRLDPGLTRWQRSDRNADSAPRRTAGSPRRTSVKSTASEMIEKTKVETPTENGCCSIGEAKQILFA